MTPENDNNLNEQNPNNSKPEEQRESAMSILEKRLAEIEAKKKTSNTAESPVQTPQVSEEKKITGPEESIPPMPVHEPVVEPTSSAPETTPSVPEKETSTEQTAARTEESQTNEPLAPQIKEEETEIRIERIPEAETPAEPVAEIQGENENVETASPEADENTVGHIIAGTIAAHETLPELPLAEPETNSPINKVPSKEQHEIAPQFEEESEEEVLLETDYSATPLPELQKQILNILKTADVRKNFRQVNAIYREFELKSQAEKTEALNKFIAEGGVADDFEFRVSPERQAVEKAMQSFRENRVREQRNEEEQKVRNLQRKQELIAQLRELVESAETKNSGDSLKTIQEEWKTIGSVPQADAKELWNSYHALLDKFYNNRSIYFELKELDRKRNLKAKVQLIERAEALENNPSINASLQELRSLHEEWKNIGPVPNEQRDPIWERFIQASEKVHERKKQFLAGRLAQEQENLTKKTEVLQLLEPYQDYNTDRINDWRDKTDEIQKIKDQWDSIGLVPKENADAINKKFWGIYKAFFHHKNQFFKALDDQKMQNLKLKTELCEQAESVKDSTDWDATKELLIQLQKKWKTIGRVPDKYSDKIWERFRAACNEFFDRRQAESQNKEAEIEKLSSEKLNYLDEISEHLEKHGHPHAGTLEQLYQMVDKWKGFDIENQRQNPRAEEKFYAMMEKYIDTVPELSYEAKNDILFKLQINKLKGGPDATSKLHQKEQSIRKEIAQLENDIRTLKTNIEFFAKSKNAEKLREEYQMRTDEANKRIQLLQKQLHTIRA